MPTTPGGRFSPGDSDDWDLTTDLAAMQVSNESASATEIAAAIAANAPVLAYRSGTNAQRLALPASQRFEGLTFATTDTRLTWYYTGGVWKNRTRSMAAYYTSTPTPAASYVPSFAAGGRAVDTHAYWNASAPTRMTIPFTGAYEFSYNVRTNGVAAMTVSPRVNGTAQSYLVSSAFGTGGAATHAIMSTIETFNAGDYIDLQVSYGSSGGSGQTRISLNYLGEI